MASFMDLGLPGTYWNGVIWTDQVGEIKLNANYEGDGIWSVDTPGVSPPSGSWYLLVRFSDTGNLAIPDGGVYNYWLPKAKIEGIR